MSDSLQPHWATEHSTAWVTYKNWLYTVMKQKELDYVDHILKIILKLEIKVKKEF